MTYPQRKHTEPIVETLDQARQQTGYGWSHIFRDWIKIVFVSLQRDDESHAEIVDSYKTNFGDESGQAAIKAYSQAFTDLLVAMEGR